jgi:hypothetical protein
MTRDRIIVVICAMTLVVCGLGAIMHRSLVEEHCIYHDSYDANRGIVDVYDCGDVVGEQRVVRR